MSPLPLPAILFVPLLRWFVERQQMVKIFMQKEEILFPAVAKLEIIIR